MYSGSLLFYHQAPQVGKESGAEGEEDIGDSRTTLDNSINLMIIISEKNNMYNLISINTFMETTCRDTLLKSSAIAIFEILHISQLAVTYFCSC